MRYLKYLKENIISNALDIDEPKVGQEYPIEKIERYINIINSAIKEMAKKEESESNDTIMADLRDKKKKWENVNTETKPVKIKTETPTN